MSIAPFQQVSGGYGFSSVDGLASEPWLLPISDGKAPAAPSPEELAATVRRSTRGFRIAANTLGAVLALLLGAQIAADWRGPVSNPSTGQIADASPPVIAVEKASLRH